MKTITIDGIKHHFKWDAGDKYISDYRSMMNAQKNSSGNAIYAYKAWWERKHGEVFTGQILKTHKDYNNYVNGAVIQDGVMA